ncbi:hypothetical protein A2159_03550 [Candidatus Woesebacteria bacterium RBG_13_34_9]|uniref:TGS domain-containing protein n=1 Tax=Candidatus Woesebacteria bacterium RBG_13_34_9 TaxID=1802477 RepID=A0A1F7X2P1_9BACT|nr:MAG: hypothetical protein A2159_03550 [Candidatus Woesebacteria bacterium RBG_13_34_9]
MEKDLEKRFNRLVKIILEYNDKADIDLLRKAFIFAKLAHTGEKRYSGIDIIWHPLETSIILASWKMDLATIIAGLLHDTVEHGAATEKDIRENFGIEILSLVEGVTKISKIKLQGSSEDLFVENLRKMFLAIAEDLRVVLLRLAERIDNLKTLEFLPEERKMLYAKESLEIYAPLADRLGISEAKTQIEDLSFPFIYKSEYLNVVKISRPFYIDAEKRVEIIKKTLRKALKKEGVNAKITGRKKGIYSLWKKLERPGIGWNIEKTIYDIIALRILVNSIKDCYLAVGVVHKYYKPISDSPIADFITAPKPNGYRSIHLRVIGPDKGSAEIQIRTFEMHQENEFGAAAHWAYSEAKTRGIKDEVLEKKSISIKKEKLDWVRELVEWQKDIKSSKEFLKAVKFDALARRIFVFSPKGDVFDLPQRATPIDFAYSVHTDLAEYIKGAKVDGKVVGLDYPLQNSQVVEIIKTKYPRGPSERWLDFVVTVLAKKEIKKQLRKYTVKG